MADVQPVGVESGPEKSGVIVMDSGDGGKSGSDSLVGIVFRFQPRRGEEFTLESLVSPLVEGVSIVVGEGSSAVMVEVVEF